MQKLPLRIGIEIPDFVEENRPNSTIAIPLTARFMLAKVGRRCFKVYVGAIDFYEGAIRIL
jgi:hypothetical protein